jgi:hypothetical protein
MKTNLFAERWQSARFLYFNFQRICQVFFGGKVFFEVKEKKERKDTAKYFRIIVF